MTKILYVEDNEDNVYMLKMRLELIEGFQIAVAYDGAEAISSVTADTPDIILMDLNVPVINGGNQRMGSDPTTKSRSKNGGDTGHRAQRACHGG